MPSDRRSRSTALPETLLWPFQRQALRNLEHRIESGQRRLLVVLAPGTGKTRLALLVLHRLLSAHPVASGCLFVGTELLRQQAVTDYAQMEIEPGRALASFYGSEEPDSTGQLRVTGRLRIQVSESRDRAATASPANFVVYDDVLHDEVVRGIEATNTEAAGNEPVTTHVVFASTATQERIDSLGQPVFQYSYRRAVLDGVLVDYDPPRALGPAADAAPAAAAQARGTQAADQASTDRVDTERIEAACQAHLEQLRDAGFLRKVCSQLVEQLDPRVPGTTLLYCLDDTHAMQVTEILRAFFPPAHDRGSEVVLPVTELTAPEAVRQLRAAGEGTRVAVSGDSLAHGVNLPAVDRLVFLRPVYSRSQYDRMLGLAARPYPDLYGPGQDKQVFHVLDALGLTRALSPYATVAPVVARPRASFQQLVEELRKLEDSEQRRIVLEEWIGKVRRRIRPFREHLDREFRAASGGRGVDDLLGYLNSVTPSEARIFFLNNRKLAPLLDEYLPGG